MSLSLSDERNFGNRSTIDYGDLEVKMRSKKISNPIIKVIILLIITFHYCDNNNHDQITGSGTLEATEITISSESNGQMLDLLVKEGDEVNVGEVIAVVDTEKLALQKEQTKAGLAELDYHILTAREGISLAEEQHENINKKYKRIKKLFEENSVPQQQLDDIETQFNLSKVQLTSAKSTLQAAQMKKKQIEVKLKLVESQIKDATIVSPVSGIVINKFIEKGENVALGSPIVTIADLTQLWIKLYVTAPELGFIQLGESVEIMVDSFPEKRFSGKVIWISSQAEFTPKNIQTKEARADLVYAVKIEISNQDLLLKIGMPADIFVQK